MPNEPRSPPVGPSIFIRHVAEEADLAETLQMQITADFPVLAEVFVSSDSTSIAAGDMWLARMHEELSTTSMLLILLNENSLKRPWINFEAGAAWLREIPSSRFATRDSSPTDCPCLSRYARG